MEQYSNLNVHGKIKQKNGLNGAGEQGTESNDVVLYPTLTNVAAGKADTDLKNITIAGVPEDEKAIVWDATNNRWQYGEAGKVDAVQIDGMTIAPTGSGSSRNKVANIPKASDSALGVVKIGTNISIDGNGVISSPSVTTSDSGTGNLVTGVAMGQTSHALTITKGIKYSTDVDGLFSNGTYIVQRKSDGQITVPLTPAADTDAASKKFVNSSIGTNTAFFKGTYDVETDLGLTETATQAQVIAVLNAKTSWKVGGAPTNNDYCFVQFDLSQDPGNVDRYDRYKYNDESSPATWVYEYTLNNSSFTQAQWNAINSGIEASDVTKLDGIEAGAEVNIIEAVKVNGTPLSVDSTDRSVNVPVASASAFGVVEVGSGTALSVTNGVITSLVTSPGNDVEFINWPA